MWQSSTIAERQASVEAKRHAETALDSPVWRSSILAKLEVSGDAATPAQASLDSPVWLAWPVEGPFWNSSALALLACLWSTPIEPALLFLGHRCPCQSSCPGVIHFPATMRQVLLAGCLRNYGSASINGSVDENAEVQLPLLKHCLFEIWAVVLCFGLVPLRVGCGGLPGGRSAASLPLALTAPL